MTVVIYYVLPMLLGRTYDLANEKVGVDIFPQSEIDNARKIERQITDSQYKMVSDSQEARDFLDINGKLALKFKAGQVDIAGTGTYLKDATHESNMMEILVKVNYETVTFTMPSTAKPLDNWKQMDKKNLGTHYVRSITYGGNLVASVKIIAKSTGDIQSIKAIVQGSLQSGSGSFGMNLKGSFEQMVKELKDSASMEIHYYGTVPIKGIPSTMEGLMELVEAFPNQTAAVNDGLGVPLRMELFPLSALDSDTKRYIEISAYTDQIDTLEGMFDDIRMAKRSLAKWMVDVPPLLTLDQLNKVGELNSKLENLSAVFSEVIGGLDLSETAPHNQFEPALKAYADNTGDMPNKYLRQFQQLKNEIEKAIPEIRKQTGTFIYTHWGQDTCTRGTEQVFKGYIMSTNSMKGGSSEFLCMAEGNHNHPETQTKHGVDYTELATVTHDLTLGEDYVLTNRNFTCSVCRVSTRSAPTMFPGRQQCPNKWTKQYSGALASSDRSSRKGEYICINGKPDMVEKQPIMSKIRTVSMTRATTSCGTLPCAKYPSDKIIPCVVCTY